MSVMSEEKKVQQHKIDSVNSLKEEFSEIQDFIFTDYRGLSVQQITELRVMLREKSAVYRVVKNRFAKLALEQLEKPQAGDNLVGPTAVAYTTEESGPVAKILFEYAKKSPVEVKGGIIGGDVFDSIQLEAYSRLPTRLELISKLMGTMNAPVQKLVSTMNAVPETFVRTLQAVADQKAGE